MSDNLPHRANTAAPAMQATAWEGDLPARLLAAFPSADLQPKAYLHQNFLETPLLFVHDLVAHLKFHEHFDVLTDLTAVDFPTAPQRFELIYLLYSVKDNRRVRIKTRAALDQRVRSVTDLFPGADWLEREVYDMFGIPFDGHPNLKRILMPEDWTGFPLRKEKGIAEMDQAWVQAHLGIESGQ